MQPKLKQRNRDWSDNNGLVNTALIQCALPIDGLLQEIRSDFKMAESER